MEGDRGLSGVEGPAEVKGHRFVVAQIHTQRRARCWHLGCVKNICWMNE